MKTIRAVEAVEITLVTGYNTDRADLAAGGSPELSLFFYAPKEERETFLQTAQSHVAKIGKKDRVLEFRVRDAGVRKLSAVMSGKRGLQRMRSFLSKSQNWPVA